MFIEEIADGGGGSRYLFSWMISLISFISSRCVPSPPPTPSPRSNSLQLN